MTEKEQIELLNKIHDELFDTEEAVVSYLNCETWMDGTEKYTHKEIIEKLLPLCKLLNRLFFEYPHCPDTQEIVD